MKKSISFIIPCYNEEKTIAECIQSVIGQSYKPMEVIVVDDGSTDNSRKIISSFPGVKLIALEKNTGNKSKAIEKALTHVKGSLVAFTDADSKIRWDFLENAVNKFDDPKVGAVSGKVISNENNLVTGARQLEYTISQDLHKKGQNVLGSIFVIPGCAAVYRKSLLDSLTLDHDTVTEDLDLTIKTHKSGMRIVYEPKAVVYTNDPFDLVSYIKQTRRWYQGTFQNLKKHKDIIGKGFLGKVELPIMFFENIFFGLFYLALPVLFYIAPELTSIVLLVDLVTIILISLYSSIRLKRYSLIFSIPVFYLMKVLQNIVWFHAMLTVLVFNKFEMVWHRADR